MTRACKNAWLNTRWVNAPALVVARLFWLSMFLLHGPGFVSLLGSLWAGAPDASYPWSVVRLVALVLSACFFLLKIVDVPWLRLAPGWRSAVAAVLVVGIIHAGAIERMADGDLSCSPTHLTVVFFVGTAWQVDRITRVLRLFRSALAGAHAAYPTQRDRDIRPDLTSDLVRRLLSAFFIPAYMGPRAPP